LLSGNVRFGGAVPSKAARALDLKVPAYGVAEAMR
jgi:hypothetical protein